MQVSNHSHQALSDIINNLPNINQQLLIDMIIPKYIFKNEPVLKIKVTYFSCGSMTIGYCWNHCLGDMTTFMSFIKHCSNLAKGISENIGEIVYDRDEYLQAHINDRLISKTYLAKPGVEYLTVYQLAKFVSYYLLKGRDKKGVFLFFTDEEIKRLKGEYSEKSKCRLSQNDVLSGHINTLISRLTKNNKARATSIVVNYRPRISLPQTLLGNFIGAVNIAHDNKSDGCKVAVGIRNAINDYERCHFSYLSTRSYIKNNGGTKSIHRILPTAILPKSNTLVISNWCKFNVYDIDFGINKPFFVAPIGKAPLPWLSSMIEGINGKGILFSLVLPSSVVNQLHDELWIKEVHCYREPDDQLPDELTNCPWIL